MNKMSPLTIGMALGLVAGMLGAAVPAMAGEQCVQNQFYDAVAVVSRGNGTAAAGYLGMLQSETGCGTTRAGGTARCDGTYAQRSFAGTAYGPGQFVQGTWTNLVRSQRQNMINDLGGCGTSPRAGAMASQGSADTQRQMNMFRLSLCGQTRYCPAGGSCVSLPAADSAAGHLTYGAMPGPSLLMTRYHDASTLRTYGGNAAVIGNMRGLGIPSGADSAVLSYVGHIGPGHAQNILNALATNPNASMGSVDSLAANCNPGLFCTGSVRDTSAPCGVRCTGYRTVGQSMQAINNRVANPNGECLREGLAAISNRLTSQPGQLSAIAGVPDGGGGYQGINSGLGVTLDAGLVELANGTLAGQEARDGCYLSSGASRYPVLCNPETSQGGWGRDTGNTGGTTGDAGGRGTPTTNGTPAATAGSPTTTGQPATNTGATAPGGTPATRTVTSGNAAVTAAERPTNNIAVLNNLSRVGGEKGLNEIRDCKANVMCEVGVLNKYQITPTSSAAKTVSETGGK